MAVDSFIPELWAAAVQVPFDKALIFGQPQVVNRDYEGMIQEQGDTVTVNSVGQPTIREYDKDQDLVEEGLTTTAQKLVIDQGQYFNFLVNDLDKVQAAGNFEGPATVSAGIGLRDKVDTYLAKQFETNALAANKLGRVTVVDDDPKNATVGQISAYKMLVKLREKLDAQSVPLEGRYVIVDSTVQSALLMDGRFTDLSASGTQDPLWNGLIGRAAGFNVLQSNNVQKVGGSGANKDDLVICAGVPSALSFANQLTKLEAFRHPKRFADVVRGLNIYGAKVFRPEGIATATVTVAPPADPAP